MENPELKKLLSKHITASLNKDEISRLKELTEQVEYQDLEKYLFEIWNAYSSTGHRNSKAFDRIKTNLKRIIQPKVSIPLRQYLYRIAVVMLIPLFGFGVYLYTRQSTLNELEQNQYAITTSKGERTSITLPDGTKVTIAANSTFTYPATFGKDNRTVNLSGEAYFEVAHNARLPFIINTKEVSVEVLGTTFNLFAYPDEAYFEASLVEGSVKVFWKEYPKETVILTPNQKVRFSYANKLITKSETDLYVETAWHKKMLAFRSDSIISIFSQLERFYGVEISVAGNIPNDHFTASYNEEDVNQVLRNLQQHYSFSYKKSGNKLKIDFK